MILAPRTGGCSWPPAHDEPGLKRKLLERLTKDKEQVQVLFENVFIIRHSIHILHYLMYEF